MREARRKCCELREKVLKKEMCRGKGELLVDSGSRNRAVTVLRFSLFFILQPSPLVVVGGQRRNCNVGIDERREMRESALCCWGPAKVSGATIGRQRL